MPWCPQCEQYLAPPRVRVDGTCPDCGRPVDAGGAHVESATADSQAVEPLDPLPWHFKLLLGAVAVYLGYRALQGAEWLVGLF